MKTFLLILIFPFFSICQPEVEVNFIFTCNGKALEKNNWYVSEIGDSLKFKTVKFFVSQPPEKGSEFSAKNVQLINWQDESTHVWSTKLSRDNKFQFTLGLDSAYHVTSDMTGDLDPSLGMYWAWQSGYVQFKVEGQSPNSSARKNKFEYHLGGYLSPFSVCRKIDLGKVSGERVDVEIQLEVFFQNISIGHEESVLIPGKEAMTLMLSAQQIFKIK